MNAVLFEKRFDTGTTMEVSEDFTVPDYQPEIRRVVGVRGIALIDGKYLTGDELEADGSVTYTVAYLDPEGCLNELSETSGYTGRIPTPAFPDDRFSASDLVMTAAAEGISCRVSGPRKFTLSCRVRLGLLSQKPVDVSMKTEGLGVVRRRLRTVKTASLCEIRSGAEISGEIREREGMAIAGAQGAVCVSDVRIEDGKLAVKGDAYVTVLLRSPENGCLITRGRAPIEETLDLPDLPSGVLCRAAVFPNVVLTELETSGDGTIAWRLEYDLDADIMKCGESEITADAYSPESECELGTAEIGSMTPAAVQNGRLTLSSRMRARPGAEFITAWGTGMIEKCAVSSGRAQISGSVKVTVVSRAEGEYLTDETTIPLRYEWEALPDAPDADDGQITAKTAVTVTDIAIRPGSAQSDGEEWSVTAELGIAAVLAVSVPLRAAVSLTPSENSAPLSKNIIRVYVPGEGESAWDVEKKFRLGKDACAVDGVYVI